MNLQTALLIVTIVCIAANAGIAVADAAGAPFVLTNSAEVGVPRRAILPLAALKFAGAAGLAIGLLALPWLGVAAGVGLTIFFVGAVAVHVRKGVLHNLAFPLAYLALAVASAVCLLQIATR